MRHLAAAGLVTLALNFACANIESPVGVTLPMVRLQPQPYSFTYNSGLTEPNRTAIRTAAAWADEWAAVVQDDRPTPPLPEVDLTKEMLILVALGERPTGGYSIFIDRVTERQDGSIEVLVRSVAPGPTCGGANSGKTSYFARTTERTP